MYIRPNKTHMSNVVFAKPTTANIRFPTLNQRYTNVALKISVYVQAHIKTIP